jgi:DNA invertase Pin-like site-specific DNA recombinase
MVIYGYGRCSTNETKQDIARQKRKLKKVGVKDENLSTCAIGSHAASGRFRVTSPQWTKE